MTFLYLFRRFGLNRYTFFSADGLAARCASLAVAGFILVGCASYTDDTREVRSEYRSGGYDRALASLEKSGIKSENKNRLLYRLEKAMILDRLGERDKSRKLLIEADKIADDLYTVSVSSTAASFIVNEAATEYSGEDYEKVAIHTMLATSFLGDGDLASARVEALKINSKLNEINSAYGENKNQYSEDAFARYLAGCIYEARGEWDSAIIDYAKAVELYEGKYRKFVDGGVPDELVQALYRLYVKRGRTDRLPHLEKSYPKLTAAAKADLQSNSDAGQVIVVHEVGHIAIKTTAEFVLPLGGQVIRFSFPVIRDRQSYLGSSTGFEVDGRMISASNVQDMNAIASQTLEDRRLRLIAKQATRLLAKGQLTEQAYRNFGPLGGIAANIYSAVSETADTRSWTLLPQAFFISRARLKPGRHQLTIKTDGRIGKQMSVDIKKDTVVILRGVG